MKMNKLRENQGDNSILSILCMKNNKFQKTDNHIIMLENVKWIIFRTWLAIL